VIVVTGYSVVVIPDPPAYGDTVFEYPIGSNVTLTCMVTPTPPSDSEFSWSCSTGCLFDLEQSVQFNDIKPADNGEMNCSVAVDGVKYTSNVVELRVIG